MRHATIVGIFTVMLTLLPGLVFAEPVIDDSKNPGYLFVLSATSGSLKGDTLTLNGVPNVIYFSDRPARKAGHLSLEKFVESWNKGSDSFKADPPNATLSLLKKEGAENGVVELMSVEQKSGSVVFKISVLEGLIPESFKTSTLFIDFNWYGQTDF
ncbi:MAG: hypothetical protein O7D98_07465 [Candidatus Dadabacteria bacterium]|nr:hypothetical protein [Candidatus Dadabacteria bacterium]